jgi:hypothetical protein
MTFGQNAAQDPNTVTGWTVQGSAAQTSLAAGVPSPGYATAANTASTAALTATGNGSPGAPSPVAGNATDILANPGYADVSPSLIQHGAALPAALVPVLASGTPFTNPVSLACTVVITGGTMTAVKVGSAQVGTGAGTYTVPGGTPITLTYSAAPTWAWTIN